MKIETKKDKILYNLLKRTLLEQKLFKEHNARELDKLLVSKYKINGEFNMQYPTLEEVETATHRQICEWYRFLPSPSDNEQVEINTLIYDKFNEKGGYTTNLSKQIGLEER